jgi:hypothetical protein
MNNLHTFTIGDKVLHDILGEGKIYTVYDNYIYKVIFKDRTELCSEKELKFIQPIKPKSILTLDLGTQMGWAIKSQSQILSGTQSFKDTRFSGGGIRYYNFQKWLINIYSTGSISEVWYEEIVRHGINNQTAVAHTYGGFLATLQIFCEDNKIPYQGVSVGTIKKHITGKGNANKQMVIDAIKLKGFDPKDDNEADALAILDYVINGIK